MSRSLQEIVDALARAGALVEAPERGTPLPDITGLTADARRLEPGMLFCAVHGAVLDGHTFVAEAARRGAAAALVESRQPAPPPPVAPTFPQIVVRNGRRAAALAAEAWYRRPASRLQLIGVTGTNGKTTSVILARHVLSTLWPMGAIGTLGAFDPAGAPVESEAGNLTTPGPIDLQATLAALVDRGAGGVAMEVSSHSLDQGRVEGLVFRAAIFTNLTRDHLDYHETFDAYFAAKAKLVGYLADAGLAVINADDAAWARLRRTPRRITFSATTPAADVTARDVRVDAKGARFTLVTAQGSHPVTLPLLGRFNVANALGVAACAVGLEVSPRVVAERLSTAPQVPGRMERIAVDPCVVLRDYAHTPDALERALETVREVTRSGGRVIVVFGAGGDRDRGKRAPMGEIAVRLSDVAIATSDNPRTEDPERILDDVEAGMSAGRPHYRIADRRAAIAQALELARPGDTILLAGKGHETYQVIGTTKEPFDEREVVRSLGAN
ncbi:MAG TPA: UDP-N-acetylmuramoyl-L-alanyl-D-glutamate--2,6-diaminopimelate ligase [Gemmatimonadales bacterium]|nr:UDP-N-acetylmuramoyl-L-alanyl-D-glutamate--2,6-diaminopimelate ligase [Gemmatimonadales bacterium]